MTGIEKRLKRLEKGNNEAVCVAYYDNGKYNKISLNQAVDMAKNAVEENKTLNIWHPETKNKNIPDFRLVDAIVYYVRNNDEDKELAEKRLSEAERQVRTIGMVRRLTSGDLSEYITKARIQTAKEIDDVEYNEIFSDELPYKRHNGTLYDALSAIIHGTADRLTVWSDALDFLFNDDDGDQEEI